MLPSLTSHPNRSRFWLTLQLAVASFCTYASIFAFRKPFTVALYEGIAVAGLPYQTVLIISQVIGYMLSKFYGIRFIAELQRRGRWRTSLYLLAAAWCSLLLFAWVPPPWGALCMLANGFVLGFMWGIVFSYVEGRKATDLLGVVLAVSFIFAGGFSRSAGRWLLEVWQVPAPWMPVLTATMFIPPLVLFYYLMERVPPPDAADEAERTVRRPMQRHERRAFWRSYTAGIVAFVLIYLLLTILRDLRDNYMANLWNELGYTGNVQVFARTETLISLVVLAVVGLLVLVRNNWRAFGLIHLLLFLGFGCAAAGSWLFQYGLTSGKLWMFTSGLGLYLSYVLFNSVYFERLLATFRIAGNVGFLIYVADAWGYLGSIGIMLAKQLGMQQTSWVRFYSGLSLGLSLAGLLLSLFSYFYFRRKFLHMSQQVPAALAG
ncbi:MAG: DUF5690 family protein [Lacibacter sp.]